MDLITKSFGAVEIKDASAGIVEAVVAQIGVVDRDADVFLPSSIGSGARVKISSFGHDVVLQGAAPVGTGTIVEQGGKAVLRGQYFLNTTRGRDAFETVKALGA